MIFLMNRKAPAAQGKKILLYQIGLEIFTGSKWSPLLQKLVQKPSLHVLLT